MDTTQVPVYVKQSLAFLLPAGLLRESGLHRYAPYCNVVRGRLLIDH